MNMHRTFGTLILAGLLLLSVNQAGFSYESPQKYGIQLGGGFGTYDMGDVTLGVETLMSRNSNNVSSEEDSGPMGNIALLFRPSRHQLWEVGFNGLLDVENTVSNADTSGQILMHANEFYLKANVVTYPASWLQFDFGVGLSYYNCELQIQDGFNRQYRYDAVGRSWGLLGGANFEVALSKRVGLILGGGGRLTNAANFSYESVPGVRQILNVIGGTRPMEVNLSGAYGNAGLRFYFDKVTKPIDFTK
jgi:hypothetical protein